MKNRNLILALSALAIVLIVLMKFTVSLGPIETVTEEDTQSVPTRQPSQAANEPAITEDSCVRPYTDDSIWNTPIDWTRAKIHPENDAMMAAFFHIEKWIGSDATQFAPNIYFVTSETPVVEVKLRQNRYRDAFNDLNIQYGAPGGSVWMPIPPDAVPAPGTDGQMVVVNLDTGEEWGINKGEINAGNWIAGGAYRYNIHNSGIPPLGFGQRGGGIGQLAGIIRRCEVERGSINHAVTLAYDFPCEPERCFQSGWPSAIPPFTKTDGRGVGAYDLPEGTRIAIRPEITLEQIRSVCNDIRGCELWAQAMQKYGGFIVDNSGHPKTYAEGDATAHWDPSMWTEDMLSNIPSDWYVVIDWNFPSTKAAK